MHGIVSGENAGMSRPTTCSLATSMSLMADRLGRAISNLIADRYAHVTEERICRLGKHLAVS